MTNLLSIVSEQLLAAAILLLIYTLVFERETMYYQNRIFLLCSFAVVLSVSFVSIDMIPAYIYVDKAVVASSVPLVSNELPLAKSTIVNTAIDYPVLMLKMIYGMGVFYMLLQMFLQLNKISQLKRGGVLEGMDEYISIRNEAIEHTFSFGNCIYTSLLDIPTEILEHELVHIRHNHTLDNIFAGICKAIMWFNPLVYILHRKLKQVHEFTCDAHASQHSSSIITYSEFLLDTAQQRNVSTLHNSFHSQIKMRLTMLKNLNENRSARFKKWLPIPVIIFTMIGFTASSYPVIVSGTVDSLISQDTIPLSRIVSVDTVHYYDEFTSEEGIMIIRSDYYDYEGDPNNFKFPFDHIPIFNNTNSKFENPISTSSIDTFTFYEEDTWKETVKIVENKEEICQAIQWGEILPSVSDMTKSKFSQLLSEDIKLVQISTACENKFDAFKYKVYLKTKGNVWEVMESSFFNDNIDIIKSNLDQIESIAIGDIGIKVNDINPNTYMSIPIQYHIHIVD